jgi:hypothetical protein
VFCAQVGRDVGGQGAGGGLPGEPRVCASDVAEESRKVGNGQERDGKGWAMLIDRDRRAGGSRDLIVGNPGVTTRTHRRARRSGFRSCICHCCSRTCRKITAPASRPDQTRTPDRALPPRGPWRVRATESCIPIDFNSPASNARTLARAPAVRAKRMPRTPTFARAPEPRRADPAARTTVAWQCVAGPWFDGVSSVVLERQRNPRTVGDDLAAFDFHVELADFGDA